MPKSARLVSETWPTKSRLDRDSAVCAVMSTGLSISEFVSLVRFLPPGVLVLTCSSDISMVLD